MFSGIIKEVGKVEELRRRGGGWEIWIYSNKVIEEVKEGDSVAVDGVCLTVKERRRNKLGVDLMKATYESTRFKYIKRGDKVNLEPAIKMDQLLSGHLVTGHVDLVADVYSIEKKSGGVLLKVKLPPKSSPYLVPKGSIAVNGVSLTIQDVKGGVISISLIPYTLENTNLGELRGGSKVNIEFDILAKYVINYLKNVRG
jgi:riboflavin synthase